MVPKLARARPFAQGDHALHVKSVRIGRIAAALRPQLLVDLQHGLVVDVNEGDQFRRASLDRSALHFLLCPEAETFVGVAGLDRNDGDPSARQAEMRSPRGYRQQAFTISQSDR